ncbi:MAG: pilus assembly protein [Rhizobiales bacterium]|nr:pilus assembly protein [Hyphomicrobiales bacterium]
MWSKIRKRLLRRFVKSERGATAIEFAMVGGPFLLMIGVVLESGSMLFTQFAIQSATQETARQIRTGQSQSGGVSAGAFKSALCGQATFIANCNSKLLVAVQAATSFSTLQTTLPNPLSIGFLPDGSEPPLPFNCGNPLDAAGVVVTYDWNFIMPWSGASHQRRRRQQEAARRPRDLPQ